MDTGKFFINLLLTFLLTNNKGILINHYIRTINRNQNMGGHKKNKRGSIPSSSASKTELIERTPENDYGVLSDPEENGPSSPVHLLTAEAETETETETVKNVVVLAAAVARDPTDSKLDQIQGQPPGDDVNSHIPPEPSQTSHVLPHSSPSLQPSSQLQDPSSQSQILQDRSSKSLNALKLKLTTDKNYSKKITLHNFLSYVILSIEIERASSSCIARISTPNVEKLVEYMIENHSATDNIKTYLQRLIEMGVITNLISAVIDFNKDQPDSLETLLSAEQMELEMVALNGATDAVASPATAIAINTETIPVALSSPEPTPQPTPQTSQTCGFFKCLRRFFSGCCGNSR